MNTIPPLPLVPVRTQIAMIAACVMLNACIAATLATAIPVILTSDLGASYIEASLLLVAGAIGSTIIAHLVGRISDRGTSRRRIAIVSAIAGGIGFLLMAQTESYLGFLLIFVTLIALANSLFPQFMALAFILAPKSVPMARALASLGWVIGPPIAGFCIAASGYGTAFTFIAFVYLALILLVLVAVPDAGVRRDDHPVPERSKTALPLAEAADHRDLVAILSGIHFLLAIPLIAIPIRIIALGGNETQVGLCFGIAALIEIPIIAMAGHIRDRVTPRGLFTAASLALASYFALLSLAVTPEQVIATSVVNGIVTGVMMGYGLIVLQARLPHRPGHASALYTNILRLTHVAALLVTGAIAQTLSFHVLFLGAAGLAGILALGITLAVSATPQARRV